MPLALRPRSRKKGREKVMFLEEAGANQLFVLLLIGIIGIVLLVVALVAYLVLGGREKKRKEERSLAAEPIEPAPKKAPTPVDDSQPFFEVMRVLRDRTNNNIIVEVEGRRYKRLADIRDGRVGRQIVQAAADLVKFSGVMGVRSAAWADQEAEPQKPAAPQPSPLPDKDRTMLKPRPKGGMLRFIDNPPPEVTEVKPAASQPAVEKKPDHPRAAPSPAASALPPETAEFLQDPDRHGVRPAPRVKAPAPPPSPAKAPDKPSIGGFFGRALKPVTTEPTPQRSMIDEIEDILQQLIARAPSPLGREIHVRTGPDGAIQLDVDGVIYNSADEVPDVVARELIKAAVRQWEKSR